MEKRRRLVIGTTKTLYATDDPALGVLEFRDDTSAMSGAKRLSVAQKGVLVHDVAARVFEYLQRCGVVTHFRGRVSEREMLVALLEMLPLMVVVRRRAAGLLCERFGIPEGASLSRPVVELWYRHPEHGKLLALPEQLVALDIFSDELLQRIDRSARLVASLLADWLDGADLELVDCRLEFGLLGGELVLADEVSPDGSRIWDKYTGRKLDKDIFRRDLGGLEAAYQELWRRVRGLCTEEGA